MRTIKFRAWHKEKKKWIHFNLNDIWQAAVMVSKYEEDNDLENINFDKAYQFTGLKDKNGKEIYEGDIVIDFNYGEETRETIVYYKNGFYYDNGIHSNWDAEKTVVIGNIYENPELLKKENGGRE